MKTVLVVDDEFSIALLLAAVLEDEGYRVITAANGRQALERMAETKPDLIISDFMMPIMDGAALGRAVRAHPTYRNIPMIMTSGLPENAIHEQFDGYSAYLRKPFFEPALLKVLSEVLGRRG
ncbi:response regulator [Microvirga massiliensis]|uniref:response regulator n=1 Tax=Microvirga massiliensis TaxID=1033741 RepID=UPI00062B332F|nr:response regulator [Microvirga massiliensis]